MSLLAFVCVAAVAVDGDTLRCSNIEDANGRVRLARIDAPEMRERGGQQAKSALAAMITSEVHCRAVDADPRIRGYQARDSYGRIVAHCRVGSIDLGAALLSRRHAVRWPRG